MASSSNLSITPAQESDETIGTTVHPDSLAALRLLKSADATVSKKLCGSVFVESNDTKRCYWSPDSVRFNPTDGQVVQLDLGAGGRIKNLPSEAFAKLVELKTLNLGGTDLPVSQIVEVLNECIAGGSGALEEVFLGGNGLRDCGMENIAQAVLLSSPNSIRKFDVRYNDIGPAGARALAGVLDPPDADESPSKIQYLYMEGNEIGDDGAAALAKALKQKNSSVLELFLGANKIGATGAKALAECIECNTTLTKLYLEGNSIGPEGAAAFTTALLNMGGKATLSKLFVDNNNIGKEGSQALAKALNSDTVIGDALG